MWLAKHPKRPTKIDSELPGEVAGKTALPVSFVYKGNWVIGYPITKILLVYALVTHSRKTCYAKTRYLIIGG